MNFEELISQIEKQSQELVWWSPEQIARGEHIINDPKKGERAWSVPRATGEFLRDKVLELKPKFILELGTSLAYSTMWMAHAAAQVDATIATIERSEHKIEIARKNISDSDFSDIIESHFGEISDIISNPEFFKNHPIIDLIFMDADRGHYHKYFPILEPHLSEHAVIIADNAGNMNARMQPFLNLLQEKNWHVEILNLDNGILIARKH